MFCSVFCVAPEAKDLERSLRAGKRLWPDMNGFIETIADAIRVVRVGDKCFPYLVDNVQHTVLVVVRCYRNFCVYRVRHL